jgi:uncharacterized protein with NRDE domain
MCLLAFRLHDHPTYDLIFAGNRDEQYSRPTAPAAFWDDHPEVLAGRDLKAGGTWMGVTRTGRWAVITNIRDPSSVDPSAPSRGHLVSSFLTSTDAPMKFARALQADAGAYNGFNLLVGTPETCVYVSNERDAPERVEPGVHGLSNATLDVSWPKTDHARHALRRHTDPENGTGDVRVEALFEMLDHRDRFPQETLPDTGVGDALESMLSPLFIESEHYGTRASTVLLISHDRTVTFAERSFENGVPSRTREFTFDIAESRNVRG